MSTLPLFMTIQFDGELSGDCYCERHARELPETEDFVQLLDPRWNDECFRCKDEERACFKFEESTMFVFCTYCKEVMDVKDGRGVCGPSHGGPCDKPECVEKHLGYWKTSK